jgi:hypothetical protein
MPYSVYDIAVFTSLRHPLPQDIFLSLSDIFNNMQYPASVRTRRDDTIDLQTRQDSVADLTNTSIRRPEYRHQNSANCTEFSQARVVQRSQIQKNMWSSTIYRFMRAKSQAV